MSDPLNQVFDEYLVVKQYISDAMRTCSNEFHGELVPILFLNNWVGQAINKGQVLDKIKKSLFYGRENAFAWVDKGEPVDIKDPKMQQVMHGILGVFTEATELLEASAKDFDPVNLKEEIGDVLWYLAIMCDALNTDFPTEMKRNIDKLKERFPDKFTEQLANNRDLDAERKVLEKAHIKVTPGETIISGVIGEGNFNEQAPTDL